MRQKPPIVLYLLLAVIAAFSLTHAFGGMELVYRNFVHGKTTTRLPFSSGFLQQTITGTSPEARSAGLQRYDTVLSIDGIPYTGLTILTGLTHQSRPGDPMTVVYRRGVGSPAQTARISLMPVRANTPTVWEIALEAVFTLLPLLCLLIGLWATLARPRNPHAWLILGILAFFNPLFVPTSQLSGAVLPFALVWNTTAQTAMPICLMFFGIYFPRRSPADVSLPWVKWALTIPILALYPIDLLYDYGQEWNFQAIHWLSPHLPFINTTESILSFTAICWFFVNITRNVGQAEGDALRRLRVLLYGTTLGLTPFGVLVIISLVRQVDVGQDVPRWLDLAIFLVLLLFPLSLAYSVVVQRALDLRILLRQGTKYFFARHTLTAISVLLAIGLCAELINFTSHTGQRRNIDVVRMLGTLASFFAFRFLLSQRLQQRLDQRFFREAYSSEQVLSELSDEARNFTETEPLLQTISQRIGSTLHVERIAIFLRSGDSFHLQLAKGMPMSPDTFRALTLPSSSATITTLSRAKAPASVYRDDPSSWLVDATDSERIALQDLSTELLVPLPGRNRLIGVMALGPKRSEEPYSRTDRQLLQTVAAQTGLALENAELLETLTSEVAARERVSREIEIAREVQQRLFPQSYPTIAGVDMAGFCRPAQAIGGDYYDLFSLDRSSAGPEEPQHSRLAIAVGDISGKGISAALLMASLRASLRSLSRLQESSGAPNLAGLMRHVNDLVYEASSANRYATFFFAEFDPATRSLLYVNAGHNPPVILRSGQSIALPATGMVVGLLPNAEYTQARIELLPGDVLLAFTDGISEAMTASEEEWGEDRMIAATQSLLADASSSYSAAQLLSCLIQKADHFTAGAPQHDDMTLLICRITA